MLNFGGGNYSLMNNMKLDYGNVGAEQGMFSPGQGQANGTGGILGKVLSSFGPVGGAVGGAIDGLLSTGSQVTGPGESRDVGGAVAKGAMKGAAGGLLKGIGDGLADQAFGKAVEAGADQAVAAGGNSLLASEATNATTQLGDVYGISALDGQKLQIDPQFASTAGRAAEILRPTMQTGSPTLMDGVKKVAGNMASRATGGLWDIMTGNAKSNIKPTGATGYDFMEGVSNGGNLGNIYASLKDGNISGGVGQGARLVMDSYRPPAYDADRFNQKFQIRY